MKISTGFFYGIITSVVIVAFTILIVDTTYNQKLASQNTAQAIGGIKVPPNFPASSYDRGYDLNRDLKVGYGDLMIVVKAFGTKVPIPTSPIAVLGAPANPDVTKDGIVDTKDIIAIRAHYTTPSLVYDLNGDGGNGLQDLKIIILAFNSTLTFPRYSPLADVNNDMRVDTNDIILERLNYTNPALVYDLNGDGGIGLQDLKIIINSYLTSVGTFNMVGGYSPLADVNNDSLVNWNDMALERSKYTTPALVYDLNGDGGTGFQDLKIITASFNTSVGTAFNALADVNNDLWINTRDIILVRSNYTNPNLVYDLNGDGLINVNDEVIVNISLNSSNGVAGSGYNPIADVNNDYYVNATDLTLVRAHE